jgi:hypothetical protein
VKIGHGQDGRLPGAVLDVVVLVSDVIKGCLYPPVDDLRIIVAIELCACSKYMCWHLLCACACQLLCDWCL